MQWRKWKLGCAVALFLSLLVAGSGLAAGITWWQFAAIFCTAAVTHFGSFIKDHPIEKIEFDEFNVNVKKEVIINPETLSKESTTTTTVKETNS